MNVPAEIFDRLMPQPNQISKQLPCYNPTAADLLQVPDGEITEAGLRQNVAVGLGYVEAWLRGIGCVPLFNLMEDAATAEISRAQLWQWGIAMPGSTTVALLISRSSKAILPPNWPSRGQQSMAPATPL